jgi:universal stress protein A
MTTPLARILIATDFGDPADAALEFGLTLARRIGTSVHLLHVFEDPFQAAGISNEIYGVLPAEARETMLRDAQARLGYRALSAEDAEVHATTAVVVGEPSRAIVDYAAANKFDLIVIGTHGRRGVAHLFVGSVAERVVRTASCPVLTVRVLDGARERDEVQVDARRTAADPSVRSLD